MFRQLLVCLLLVSFVAGQTAPPTSPAPAAPSGAQAAPAQPGTAATPPAPEPPKVGAEDTVLTIKGYCPGTTLEGDACKTTVTKAEFEKLADTLQPNMSPAMRRQLANAYARMLTMSAAAEKRDLEKTPHFDEAMHFARMQILSQDLSKALQADANNVSDQDIKDYYDKNPGNFEQATFVRLFIPHTKRIETPAPASKKAATGASKTTTPAKTTAAPVTKSKDPVDQDSETSTTKKTATSTAKAPAKKLTPEEQQKAGEEAMKKEANLLHARLAKGEDPDKLEKEAFVAGGLQGTPPPTKMEKVRRTNLPAAHQSVMDLKPGDVSDVISDPSGNYVYKMISKETLPLDNVKKEIQNQLSAQRYRDAMQKFQNNADLNDAYFGPGRPAGMPMPPRGPRPPSKPGDDDRD